MDEVADVDVARALLLVAAIAGPELKDRCIRWAGMLLGVWPRAATAVLWNSGQGRADEIVTG